LNITDKSLVNFAGPSGTNPPTYSASFVALGNYFPDLFKNKIVMIGSTSLTLQDFFPTPFLPSSPTPGMEVVTNSVATILQGNYLQKAPPWTTIILIILAAMTNVIHKHGGTLGKHEGDTIGAFFGELIHYDAHANCAVEAAL
jgi:CHASE2 domain-containing sensor protein